MSFEIFGTTFLTIFCLFRTMWIVEWITMCKPMCSNCCLTLYIWPLPGYDKELEKRFDGHGMSWKFLSVKLGTFVLLHHLLLLQICILNTITITIKQLTH